MGTDTRRTAAYEMNDDSLIGVLPIVALADQAMKLTKA